METTVRKKTHIPALDGLRAVAVLLICWYHIWQQSWLAPYIRLGRHTFSLDAVPRTGYLFVDLMLLLSAFLLFLPHAENMVYGTPLPDTKTFYLKRAARIVPSYMLAAFTMFFVALFAGKYANPGEALRDILATATFTQTFSARTYIGTKINGVLWTAAVEMAFYLIFPLLAKAFRKKPLLTYFGMMAAACLYIEFLCVRRTDLIRVTLNQLPAFFGVFANGMLAAYIYTLADARLSGRRPWWLALLCVLVFAGCVYGIRYGMVTAASSQTVQLTQAEIRHPMAGLFALLTLSMALGGKLFSALFGNRLMRLAAAVSYNMYLWHQWIAVHIKEMRVPYWTGDTAPNMTGDHAWQVKYTAMCFGFAVLMAFLVTYLVEKPAARALTRPKKEKETEE